VASNDEQDPKDIDRGKYRQAVEGTAQNDKKDPFFLESAFPIEQKPDKVNKHKRNQYNYNVELPEIPVGADENNVKVIDQLAQMLLSFLIRTRK